MSQAQATEADEAGSSRPIKQRIVSAGIWSLVGHGFSLTIRFASNLLLTRLLAPDMFGVMAIAMIIITGLGMFSDVGLDQSIIRSTRGHDVRFLNTVWVIQIFRSILIWLFVVVAVLLLMLLTQHDLVSASSVYGNPSLRPVLLVLSVTALISGLSSTKIATSGRSLFVRNVVQMEVGSQAAGLCGVIAWLFFDRSVWALVFGAIVTSATRTLMSHLWLPGQANRWHWDRSAASEIFSFGKWIFLTSIAGFLLGNSDRLILGGLIDARTLGVYSIAVTIFALLEQILTRVIASAVFPALSEFARNRRSELKKAYSKFYMTIALAAYFCFGVLVLSSKTVIGVLYDARYSDAGWMLGVLSIGLLATPLQVSIQCFIALGAPQIHFRVLAVRLFGLLLSLPLGFQLFGLEGALVAIAANQLLALPIVIVNARKFGVFDLKKELVVLPAIGLGLMSGAVLNLAIDRLHAFL